MYNPETGIIELAQIDQPYEVALLVGYKRDCNYCGIDFVAKPNQVRFEYNPIGDLSVDIVWDKPILSRFLGDSSDEKIYFAVVGPNPRTRVLEVAILEAVEVSYTKGAFDILETKYHCKYLIHSNTSLVNRVEAAYKRNFLSSFELTTPLCSFDKLPELTVTSDARNCDVDVIEKLKKEIQSAYNFYDLYFELIKGMGVDYMFKNVPIITRCIINDPAVVVFWSDDTKTVGKCMGDDEFNPEIGLAMAISRKYYELIGFPNPRSAFKNQLKAAENRSAKTKEKRERKLKLLEAAKDDVND